MRKVSRNKGPRCWVAWTEVEWVKKTEKLRRRPLVTDSASRPGGARRRWAARRTVPWSNSRPPPILHSDGMCCAASDGTSAVHGTAHRGAPGEGNRHGARTGCPANYGTGGHGSGSLSFLSGWFATSGMLGFASLASWG